ncbi:MAG: A/G-specific adenine glycosylase [Dehalococcoidia bacterium]|nr:A/G-specific adenine glycosylase [Dehalococcoidia bacterium]
MSPGAEPDRTELARLRRAIRRWYAANGRHDLPWRQTRDPYAVLVSEVMLQQTQVDRVVPYWEAWLERWPDAQALAQAETAEVIRAWSGLGYNRRARNLQRAALAACERYGGIPCEPAKLRELPGIGPYTASAVASFAGERRTAVVDTNIGRVIARAVLGQERAGSPRAVEAAAELLLPPRKTRDWNLALMDLGATVCRSRNPACGACPVARLCAWRAAGQPAGEARQKQQSVPFETTARFARGRIVEALRAQSPLPEREIQALLPTEHQPHTAHYLAALERDGLIEADGSAGWALAGHCHRMSIASPKL